MKRLLFTSAVSLLLSVGSLAQSKAPVQYGGPTMTLTGVAYDPKGSVVVTSMELIARDEAGKVYETATNEDGVYKLTLPLGPYGIEAKAPGFCPWRMERYWVVNATYGRMTLDFVFQVPDGRGGCKHAQADEKPAKPKKGGRQKAQVIIE